MIDDSSIKPFRSFPVDLLFSINNQKSKIIQAPVVTQATKSV